MTDIPDGRSLRVGRRPRHGWIPEKAGVPLDEHARPRYEEAVDLLFTALERALLAQGRVLRGRRLARRPVPDARSGSSSAARPTGRTSSLPSTAGASQCPLLPYKALEEQLDLYRAKCAEHGNEPTSSGSTHVISTRTTTPRCARAATGLEVHLREQLTAARVREAGGRRARQGGLRLLRVRDHGAARRGAVRAARRGGLRLGRNARRDHRADRGDPEDLSRISEIGITVNAGGAPHWMAIKNQELFASSVIPRVREASPVEVAQIA